MEIVFVEGTGTKRSSEKVLELDVPFKEIGRRDGTLGRGAVRRLGKEARFILRPEGNGATEFARQGEGQVSFMPAPVLAVSELNEDGDGLLSQVFPVKRRAGARK